jgi:hypothetical protein
MKWQKDEAFVAWLVAQQYARREQGKLHLCMSGGVYLYMYEAWFGAKQKNPAPSLRKQGS